MILRGLSAWGIQIGSFAAGWAPFVLKCFKLFHLHTGEANSYYPRGPIMRKGSSPNFKTEWDRGFLVPGAFKLDHSKPLELKFYQKYHPTLTFILGLPFLITPEGRKGRNRMQKSKDANSTQCSQAVSHPSTNRAQHCLTSVIGRELVYSMWYGRCREKRVKWARVDRQAALLWG